MKSKERRTEIWSSIKNAHQQNMYALKQNIDGLKEMVGSNLRIFWTYATTISAERKRIAVLLGLAFVMVLGFISLHNHIASDNTNGSPEIKILGLIVIVAIISFFWYKISQSNQNTSRKNGSASFSFEFRAAHGYGIGGIIVVIFLIWLVCTYGPAWKNDYNHWKSNNAETTPVYNQPVEPTYPETEITYGRRHFEKGVWYKYYVKDGENYFFHYIPGHDPQYKPLGDGHAWYAVQFDYTGTMEVTRTKD